jgi:hypothetical protein
MRRRYRALKLALEPTKRHQHYSSFDEHQILAWAYCWYHKTPKRPHQAKIWEAAESHLLVFGKKASEMESKYRHLVRGLGGKEKTYKEAMKHVGGQSWLSQVYKDDDEE